MRTDHGPGMSGSGRSARRFRTVLALAAGIAIGVALTATPVSGHVGNSVSHLWNAHIKPKTDARYYTKAQANARFAPRGAKAADSELLDGLDSAAFLRSDGKAADAELLDGLDSTAFLPATGKATDADRLDGLDSAAFLRAGAKAADADLLDGVDSAQFIRGNGQAVGRAIALSPGTNQLVLSITETQPPNDLLFTISYSCQSAPTSNGTFIVSNPTSQGMNLFWESGGDSPTYVQIASGLDTSITASPTDSLLIQAQGTPLGVLTLEVATVRRTSDCHAQAEGVLTR
jgi:hypothetical protein